jgi:hypothetical protein
MAGRSFLRLGWSLDSEDDRAEDSQEGPSCGHTAEEDMCIQVS